MTLCSGPFTGTKCWIVGTWPDANEEKELAAALQIDAKTINEYESGKAIPNNQLIAKMERTLGAKLPRAPKGR